MSNADASTMIRDWGCNVLVTGGDLVFFIKGLQTAIRQIKRGAGETVESGEAVSGVTA